MPALPRKKTPAATKAGPQFRVVGKDEPAAPAGGLNFGALAAPAAATTAKKDDKPTLVLADGEALALLDQYVGKTKEFNPLNKLVGSKGSIKAQLREHLTRALFETLHGRPFTESTFRTTAPCGDGVKLTFKNAYSRTVPPAQLGTLVALAPKAAPHFKVVNTLTIDFEQIPLEKQQPLVDALIAAAQQLEITAGIETKQIVQPVPGFHEQRTAILTPEENLAVDSIIPITAYPQLA